MTAWTITLKPWPLLNQFSPNSDDGRLPEDAKQQCGATVCAAFIRYATGIRVSPDFVKDKVIPNEGTGILTNTGIQAFLRDYTTTPSTLYFPQPTDRASAMAMIRTHLFAGQPVFAAKHFSSTDPEPHWIAVIGGAGPDTWHTTTLSYHDPALGTLVEVDVGAFWSSLCLLSDPNTGASSLVMVGVGRSRDLFLV